MSNSLKMDCQGCGKMQSFPVSKAEPKLIYDDRLVELLGLEKFHWRERRRVCEQCGADLQTVELSKQIFFDMSEIIDEYVRNFEYMLSCKLIDKGDIRRSIIEKAARYVMFIGPIFGKDGTEAAKEIRNGSYDFDTLMNLIDDVNRVAESISPIEGYFLSGATKNIRKIDVEGQKFYLTGADIRKIQRKLKTRTQTLRKWRGKFWAR